MAKNLAPEVAFGLGASLYIRYKIQYTRYKIQDIRCWWPKTDADSKDLPVNIFIFCCSLRSTGLLGGRIPVREAGWPQVNPLWNISNAFIFYLLFFYQNWSWEAFSSFSSLLSPPTVSLPSGFWGWWDRVGLACTAFEACGESAGYQMSRTGFFISLKSGV